MRIRAAQEKDAPAIVTNNILLAQETEQLVLHPQTVLAGVRAVLADPEKGFYVVAEEDNIIIGQLMITIEWSDWRNKPIWWVQSVFVKKEYRQNHVFTTLLASIKQQARKQDAAFLRLYVHNMNLPAIKVYKKMGWDVEPYLVYHHAIDQ